MVEGFNMELFLGIVELAILYCLLLWAIYMIQKDDNVYK